MTVKDEHPDKFVYELEKLFDSIKELAGEKDTGRFLHKMLNASTGLTQLIPVVGPAIAKILDAITKVFFI